MKKIFFFQLHKPPYASCIFFELYKENELPFVQIFYRNSTESNVPALDIPECGTKCPLSQLYDLYGDILPTKSFDHECALHDDETVPDDIHENDVL